MLDLRLEHSQLFETLLVNGLFLFDSPPSVGISKVMFAEAEVRRNEKWYGENRGEKKKQDGGDMMCCDTLRFLPIRLFLLCLFPHAPISFAAQAGGVRNRFTIQTLQCPINQLVVHR